MRTMVKEPALPGIPSIYININFWKTWKCHQ
jgi:hypothetical protein